MHLVFGSWSCKQCQVGIPSCRVGFKKVFTGTIKKCLLCGKILLILTLKVKLSVLPTSFYLRGRLGRDFIDIIASLHVILETIEGFLPSLLS